MYFFDIDMDKFDILLYNYHQVMDMYDETLFEKHTEIFSGDIGMYYCGKRVDTKNHVYGPEIRTHFLIVLVEKGTAVLYRDEEKLRFKSGDVLVMFPGEKIFYKAQTDWSIKWVGVSGKQLEDTFKTMGVTREKPIFTLKKPE
ncbi:MAG: AraC family ligand binding domain-containing protein, partial [Clostridia bacterium]|nr:AraC family ligand binding domain-containing protein [Clostridia bacterium]